MKNMRVFFLFAVTVLCSGLFAQKSRKFVLESGGANVSPELVVQEFHDTSANFMKYSKDGKYLLTVGREMKIWDVASGKLLRTFLEIPDPCYLYENTTVDFHTTGKFIILKLKDKQQVCIVDAETGNVVSTVNVDGNSNVAVQFSPDGKYFVVAGRKIEFFDFETKRKEFTLEENYFGNERQLSFSENSDYLAVGYNIGYVYDVKKRKRIGTFSSDLAWHSNITMSPSGKYVAVGDPSHPAIFLSKSGKKSKKILDLPSSLDAFKILFTPDEKRIIFSNTEVGNKVSIIVMDLETKKQIHKFDNGDNTIKYLALLPNSKKLAVSYLFDQICVRNLDTFASVQNFPEMHTAYIHMGSIRNNMVFFSGKRPFVLKNGVEKMKIPLSIEFLLDSAEDKVFFCYGSQYRYAYYDFVRQRLFELNLPVDSTSYVKSIECSDDGRILVYIDENNKLYIYDLKRQELKWTLENSSNNFMSSYTGKFVFIETAEKGKWLVIDTDTGTTVIRYCGTYPKFSPNDDYVFLYDGIEHSWVLYEVAEWKKIRGVKDENSRFQVSISLAVSSNGKIYAVQNRTADWTALDLRNITDGSLVKRISTKLPYGSIDHIAFSRNDEYLYIRSGNRCLCYSTSTGELLYTILGTKDGEYITYTPEGYFTGSPGGINKFVHLVNGMEVSELGQYAETLFRPDLVAAKIRGESVAESENAVLAELVTSGEPPLVSFSKLPPVSSSRDITVDFSVQDAGGGIGNVYVSVNGKVKQIADGSRSFELVGGNAAQSSKKKNGTVSYSPTISLSSGVNTIEAFATNKAGKVESRRAIARISWKGAENKPNLHVLAVGVNEYSARGVSKLNYAVPDVESIASSFSRAGKSLYGSVSVVALTDEKASSSGIVAEFNRLSNIVKSDDVFVFYVSGHGTSYNGDYYFIPVDFDGNLSTAVSKTFIMNNMQKIAAQKSLLILDTCYSGAIVNESDTTAYQRLARATGQAIIAASSDAQTAIEGYEGHGVFTYALLEGLSGKAGSPDDKSISLLDLAAYVSKTVPKLSEQKWNYSQMPWFDIRKQDFPLVGK